MRPVAACGVLRRPSSKGGTGASRLKNGALRCPGVSSGFESPPRKERPCSIEVATCMWSSSHGRSGQCPCRRWDDLPMDVAVFEGHDLYQ